MQIVFCTSTDPTENYISPENVGGMPHCNQLQWIEFFAILEPLQSQCISSGKKLVTVMGDIRNADIQVSYWSTAQLPSQQWSSVVCVLVGLIDPHYVPVIQSLFVVVIIITLHLVNNTYKTLQQFD